MLYMRYLIVVTLVATASLKAGPTTAPADVPDDSAATSRPEKTYSHPEAAARQARDEAAVIDQFKEYLGNSPSVSPAAMRAALSMLHNRETGDELKDWMTSAIAIISEPYKKAVEAVDGGRPAEARALLEPLLASEDFYLSAHASALKARALVEEDRLEEAQKVLEGLDARRDEITARTFLAPELLFLLGYCRLSNLEYDKAAATLQELERLFPDAPERYRLPAQQMLAELKARRPEGLGDVSDLMGYAGRQLRHARMNQTVQQRQDKAVELLTKLIEEAEQREQQQQQQSACKSCGGKGCPKCQGTGRAQGNQRSQRGAERSVLPPGQGSVGELHHSARARPGEQWGNMRPEQRERIMQALRQSFPSRYRQLVEQYYKQLSKEE